MKRWNGGLKSTRVKPGNTGSPFFLSFNPLEKLPLRGCRGGVRAFTLLEVIIAMLLLMLLLFSVGQVVLTSQVRMKNSSRQNAAMTIAEGVIESIRGMSWNDVDKVSTYDGTKSPPDSPKQAGTPRQYPPAPYPVSEMTDLIPVAESGEVVKSLSSYGIIVRTLYDPAYPGCDDLLSVTVEVHWREGSGSGASGERSVTLASGIFRR